MPNLEDRIRTSLATAAAQTRIPSVPRIDAAEEHDGASAASAHSIIIAEAPTTRSQTRRWAAPIAAVVVVAAVVVGGAVGVSRLDRGGTQTSSGNGPLGTSPVSVPAAAPPLSALPNVGRRLDSDADIRAAAAALLPTLGDASPQSVVYVRTNYAAVQSEYLPGPSLRPVAPDTRVVLLEATGKFSGLGTSVLIALDAATGKAVAIGGASGVLPADLERLGPVTTIK